MGVIWVIYNMGAILWLYVLAGGGYKDRKMPRRMASDRRTPSCDKKELKPKTASSVQGTAAVQTAR